MKKVLFVILVSLFTFSLAIVSNAQEDPPKYQTLMISEDIVFPDKIGEYEKALKEYISIFSENNFPYPIYIYNNSELTYYYVIPVKNNFGDLDTMYKYLGKAAKTNPEKWKSVWQMFNGTYEYNLNSMIIQNYELSFFPENPKLNPGEGKFQHWSFLYVKPGMAKEFKEVLKKWKELYKSNGITVGYNVFWGDIGTEQPLFIISSSGKDAADYWSYNKTKNDTFGEEAKTLRKEGANFLRKIEYKHGWYRPELSYIPVKEE